jgi:hypothetical protein
MCNGFNPFLNKNTNNIIYRPLTYKQTKCKDCYIIRPRLFMLKDELWERVCDNIEDILCMGCVIKRLCRNLTLDDFKPNVEVNKEYILLLSHESKSHA